MKLTDYIKEHHNGNASAFAVANDYHITQVKRYLKKEAFIDANNVPFYTVRMNKKEAAK